MEFFIENWYIVFTLVAVLLFVGIHLYRFCKLPSSEQINAVREWLVGAVTDAEKALGGGTGKLKLRQVYDLFVTRFPWIARVMTFDCFSGLVDEALVEMREMLEKNEAVKNYVEGGGADA